MLSCTCTRAQACCNPNKATSQSKCTHSPALMTGPIAVEASSTEIGRFRRAGRFWLPRRAMRGRAREEDGGLSCCACGVRCSLYLRRCDARMRGLCCECSGRGCVLQEQALLPTIEAQLHISFQHTCAWLPGSQAWNTLSPMETRPDC